METPEQYTVKTPEEILNDEINRDHERGIRSAAVAAMREYSSELIKENERLRGTIGVECVKQLLEIKQVLNEAREFVSMGLAVEAARFTHDPDRIAAFINEHPLYIKLSKFQPKKDESIEQRG